VPPDGNYRLFCATGWGSALVEGFLAIAGLPFEFEDVSGFDQPGPARDHLLAVNPLAQVPTLVLPGGEVMVESAAIALVLAERHPEARLAPDPRERERPAFLRRLIWLVANIYPTFTYFDYPDRWIASEAEFFRARVLQYRKALWLQFERDLGYGRTWVLEAGLTALDVYVAVMTHWRPGRAWFKRNCPRLFAIATNADKHPSLEAVLARNFPS
jgi:GST-like protein